VSDPICDSGVKACPQCGHRLHLTACGVLLAAPAFEGAHRRCSCEAGISSPNLIRSIQAHRWSASEETLREAITLIEETIKKKRIDEENRFRDLVGVRIVDDFRCDHTAPTIFHMCLGHAEILREKLVTALTDACPDA